MKGKVLVISNMFPSDHHPSYGVFVARAVRALEAKGVAVRVVSMNKVDTILAKLLAYFRFWLCANLHIAFGRYDRIYIHQPLHSLICSMPAALSSVRRMAINFHGHDLLPVTWRGLVLQRILRRFIVRVPIILVPSNYFAKIYYERFVGLASVAKASVYYSGGVEDCYFVSVQKTPRDRGRTALFLSRFVEGKGWRDFVSLAEHLIREYKDFRFVIAGEGSDLEVIRELIYVRGMAEYFTILHADNPEYNARLMRDAKYFVFPTKFSESLALVNLEAMASGCIVLSSRFAAAEEYVLNGSNGFLIEADQFVSAATDVISSLEADPVLCTSISRDATLTAERFREDRVSEDLLRLLDLDK